MESLGMTVLRHPETSNKSTPQRLLKELTSFLKPFGREPALPLYCFIPSLRRVRREAPTLESPVAPPLMCHTLALEQYIPQTHPNKMVETANKSVQREAFGNWLARESEEGKKNHLMERARTGASS